MSDWGQEERSLSNILNYGLGCCPLTLLVKDHKSRSIDSGEAPPVRPVMGGNAGGNAGMSEFVSLALEPVANEMEDSLEILATNGLLNDIGKVIRILDEEDGARNEKLSNKSSHDEDPELGSEQEVPNRGMDNNNSTRLDEECIIKDSD